MTSTETSLTPQAKIVLDYLKTGRDLTGLIAMVTLGVVSLTSRISELRKAGVNVQTGLSKDHNGKRYRKYWIAKEVVE
jgi:hypothetical protein